MRCQVEMCVACNSKKIRFSNEDVVEYICGNCGNVHDEKPVCGGELAPTGSEGNLAGYVCQKCGNRAYGRISEGKQETVRST